MDETRDEHSTKDVLPAAPEAGEQTTLPTVEPSAVEPPAGEATEGEALAGAADSPEAPPDEMSEVAAALPAKTAEPPAASPAESVPPAVDAPRRGVSQTPFLLYLAAWIVFIVASATLLLESARTTGVLYSDRYEYEVYAAAALAALGPLLALVVWIATRLRRTADERRGLFAASMLAGAGVTFVGTVLWLVLLFVLDLYQAGVFS